MNSKAFNFHCWKYLPLCILLLPNTLFAQTVSFTNPSNLSVCDSSIFTLNILNEEGQPLIDGQLTLEFPDCMQYSPGSIQGASELDISDLSQPVFTLADLVVDGTLSISLTQIASCACVDAINSAEQFNNTIQVDYSNGSAGLTTSLYEVETPLLVITNVTNTYLSGQKGDILQRSYTIYNTRFGPLSSFVLTDTYGPGIEISSNQGTVLEDSPGFFELELNSSDFMTIGDGDGLFEFEESITVIENIKIVDCGIDLDNSISQIEFSWGCFNLICQDEIQTAIVEIMPTEDQPDLSFEPYTSVPYCFCGPEGHLHGLTITNNGESPAFDINVDLRRTTDGEGMDINSFIVDSIGSMQSLPAIGLSVEDFEGDCVAPQPVYRTVTFTLEELGPGESVFVHWQVYFCKKGCNSPLSFWEYKYAFYRECPPDLVTEQVEYISVLKTDEPLITSVFIDPDCGFLLDDTFCNYQYSVSQDTLDVASGYLAIDFVLPCGFTWLDPAPTLAGVLPDVFEVNANTEQTTVYMEYQLPLPQDSAGFNFQLLFDCDLLCDTVPLVYDSIVTSCIDYEVCNPLAPPNIFFDMVTTLQICEPFGNECAHQSCQTIFQPFECEAQDTNYIGSSGYYFYRNNARRINYGLADNDNDQFPDPVGMLDLSAIELQRFIPGDTILSTINGIVVADETGATFNQAVFDLFFNPVGATPEINEGLFSLEGFEFLEAELQVFDFSSSTYYNCPITETTNSFSNTSSIHHVFDIEFEDFSCGLPVNFELAHADSLLLKVYTRIGVNPIQEDPNSSVPPLIQISHTSTSQIFSDDAETTSLNCGCDTDLLELSGYEYQIANGVFVVPPCDTSEYLGANFLNFSLAASDLFPFEYRWGALFENLELQLSDGFELVESQVSRVQWQSGIPLIVDKPVTPELLNSLWYFQLDTCQAPPLDEGFSILTQHRLTRDCHLEGAYELITYTDIMFTELLPEDENPRMLSDTSNSLRALNPDLDLTGPLLLNTSSDNKFRWELDLINNINSVASQMSGVAYNVWLSPESLSGSVSDFILEDIDNDIQVPLVNGLFQLGDLDPEINRNFRLVGLNTGCGLDSVVVHFGWNCEELQTLDDDPCFQRELLLEGLSPDGEIDFQVFSPTDSCITLCDTVPYHTIEIFNADLGAICALELTAYIPSGFQVLPGSCELSYPLGAAFTSIPDPQDLGNGQYLWAFDTFSDSLLNNCLPGIPLTPSNSLQLRFLGMTDCDFPINSTILFVTEGLQTCQDFANAVLRESEPVCIETNAPDGQAFFNASLKEEVVCEEEAILEVALIMDVASVLGDTIEIVLPPGILYVPGSYNPLINAPAGPPNITFYGTSQVLRFGVPANIPAANVVSFEAAVSGFLEEDCGNLIAIFRATRLTDALCAASGETCSVAYELGNGFLEIPIQRPEFSIESFTISAEPSGGDLLVTYQVEVANLGPSFTQNLTLQF